VRVSIGFTRTKLFMTSGRVVHTALLAAVNARFVCIDGGVLPEMRQILQDWERRPQAGLQVDVQEDYERLIAGEWITMFCVRRPVGRLQGPAQYQNPREWKPHP